MRPLPIQLLELAPETFSVLGWVVDLGEIKQDQGEVAEARDLECRKLRFARSV